MRRPLARETGYPGPALQGRTRRTAVGTMAAQVDFLLECIGFPPDHGLPALVRTVMAKGEPIPYRGPGGEHLRYPLSGGLEVRAEREDGQEHWNVWPFFRVDHRLRLAVLETRALPDSPFDRLLFGVANPALPETAGTSLGDVVPGSLPELLAEEFLLTAYVTDARRLPAKLPAGHVLAVSVAGFALDVSYVGPEEQPVEGRVGQRARLEHRQPQAVVDAE